MQIEWFKLFRAMIIKLFL